MPELLIPREKIFSQLLEQESDKVLAGAQALPNLFHNHYDGIAEKRDRIKDVEHHGDEIVPHPTASKASEVLKLHGD